MAGLLSSMLMGPAQRLRMPQAAPMQAMATPQASGLLSMINPNIGQNPLYQRFDQNRDVLANMFLGGVGAESPLERMRGMAGGIAKGRETAQLLEAERAKQREAQQQINATMQAFQKAGRTDLLQAVQGGLPIGEAWKTFLAKDVVKPTDDMREYEFARQQGYQGSFQDFMMDMRKAGATSVTFTDGAPGLGKLSTDYGYKLGPDGQPIIGPDGLPQAAPVPGSPAASERQQRQRAQTATMQSYEQKYNLVDSAITDVLADTSAWTAGPGGALLSNIPGTPAYDMARTIETIKANLGFEELQAMRDNSPTGGALGQVTERELAFLQAAQGNLDQAQTPAQLKKVLSDIQQRRREFREARRRAYEIDYGVPAPDMGGNDVSLDQLLDMYGD